MPSAGGDMDVGGGQGWILPPLNTTPGGLIQSVTVLWGVGRLDPLCGKRNLLAPVPNTIP